MQTASSRCGYAHINLGHVRLEELVEPAEKLEPAEGPRLDLNQTHSLSREAVGVAAVASLVLLAERVYEALTADLTHQNHIN